MGVSIEALAKGIEDEAEPAASRPRGRPAKIADATCKAAGGIWLQSSTGIGGTGGISPFYGRRRAERVRPVNGYAGLLT
jgi:hypothetical protein